VPKQRRNAELLGRIVFDDQEALRRGLAYSLICESAALTLRSCRLLTKKSAARQRVLAVLVERNDLTGM